MYDLSKFFGGCLITILFFLLTAIVSTLIGAFIGWVVGWFFGNTILSFFASIGIEGYTMVQLGAVLGFVGGFFRGTAFNYNVAAKDKDAKDKEKNQQNLNKGNF